MQYYLKQSLPLPAGLRLGLSGLGLIEALRRWRRRARPRRPLAF